MAIFRKIYIPVILIGSVALLVGIFYRHSLVSRNSEQTVAPQVAKSENRDLPSKPSSQAIAQQPAQVKDVKQVTPEVVSNISEAKPIIAVPSSPSPSLDTTDTSSSSGRRPDYLGGQEATASINAGGKKYQFSPNQGGCFGRVVIEPNATVNVKIAYPQAAANDPIIVESVDGGALDNGQSVKTTQLDETRGISFGFKSGVQEGIYRVTLRQGSDLKQIDFWVGPELAVRQ